MPASTIEPTPETGGERPAGKPKAEPVAPARPRVFWRAVVRTGGQLGASRERPDPIRFCVSDDQLIPGRTCDPEWLQCIERFRKFILLLKEKIHARYVCNLLKHASAQISVLAQSVFRSGRRQIHSAIAIKVPYCEIPYTDPRRQVGDCLELSAALIVEEENLPLKWSRCRDIRPAIPIKIGTNNSAQ